MLSKQSRVCLERNHQVNAPTVATRLTQKLVYGSTRFSKLGPRNVTARVAMLPNIKGDSQDFNGLEKELLEESAESKVSPYPWARNWWPASPLSYLDKSKPLKITILGKDLALWWNEKSGTFEALEDLCPHRLAPLSAGRIVDSKLTCSYHGWQFSSGGQCVNIPQLHGAPGEAACSDRKSCATSYPTAMVDGLLHVWLDLSEEGLAESRVKEPYKGPGGAILDYYMSESPNEYTFWLEQAMDPSHANFLHHGLGGFDMSKMVAMESRAVQDVDLMKGFTWVHRGYEERNEGMNAYRKFVPPFATEVCYDKTEPGSITTQAFSTIVVPVRPGVCRTIFRFGTSPPPSPSSSSSSSDTQPGQPQQKEQQQQQQQGSETTALSAPTTAQAPKPEEQKKKARGGLLGMALGLASKLPHWVFVGLDLGDQDVVIMHQQELRMRRSGLRPRDYTMMAFGADNGVAASNRWTRMAGPPGALWLNPNAAPAVEKPLEQLLDRRARHVDHCVICQKGFRFMTRVCQAANVAAAAAAVSALLIGVRAAALESSRSLAAPALCAAGLAVLLGLAAWKLWEFREDRFISGLKSWKRRGGLALTGPQI